MVGVNVKYVVGAGAAMLVLLVTFQDQFSGADGTGSSGLRGGGGVNAGGLHTATEGADGTLEFRRYFYNKAGQKISPWHDIPLSPPGAPKGVYNFICEIPRGSRAKMETNKEEKWNPIIQDTKHGKLRFYHSDSTVNYGAFPQTWEDPEHGDPETTLKGDNDPLDVLEIGSTPCNSGDVYAVKAVGILAMEDDGEMDWKVIVIRTSDPLAANVDDVGYTNKNANPGVQEFLANVRVWFRDYKLPDGKPENKFAFDGNYLGVSKANAIIAEQHGFWKALVQQDNASAKGLTRPFSEFWWH